MPKVGAKMFAIAPFATAQTEGSAPKYTGGKVIGELIKVTYTPNYDAPELYADNAISEQSEYFTDGSGNAEINDLELADAAALYGATITVGSLTYNRNDVIPFCGMAFYEEKTLKGVRTFIGTFLPKTKATPTGKDVSTRNKSTTYTTSKLNFKYFACDTGDYEINEEFETEVKAITWVKTKLGMTLPV